MADDPVARELAQFRGDWRDDVKDLKALIGQMVRSDVNRLEQQQQDQRIAALEQAKKDAELARKEDRDRLRSTIRWVVGVCLIPTVIGIIQIWSTLRGGG